MIRMVKAHTDITEENDTRPSESFGAAVSVQDAFEFCERIAKSHYENFPVASLFIPKEKRPHIWAIYAFARLADDFADEGDSPPHERLQQLDSWQQQLNECYEGRSSHPVFVALEDTVRQYDIPQKPFSDLLTAFRLDVTQKRFRSFDSLLQYCQHSANPIGQVVLHVFHNANDRTLELSDRTCTALQLANFWQDVSADWKKGRLYIPLEDLDRFGYTEQDLELHIADGRFRKLMAFEVQRTRGLFLAGKPLLSEAHPALRLELTITWRGGLRILDKIEQQRYDVLHARPTLSFPDKLSILGSSLLRLT